MKRIIALGMTSIMALSMVSTAIVFADDTTKTTDTTTTATTTDTTTTTTAAPSAAETKALNDRLAKRKADLKIKLNSADKLRIQARCVASQALIGVVKGRFKDIETNRAAAYKTIVDHLTDLSTKLKNKNTDTTALDTDTTALNTDITTFNTDLATYKLAVSDLAVMDCKSDPDAFKASLLAARSTLETVNKDSTAIRSYVSGTIKPLLVTIRTQLDTTKAAGGQ